MKSPRVHILIELLDLGRGVKCGDLESRSSGSNPAKKIFFPPSIIILLHKYKFQIYHFKLVHCGLVVTTRALRSSRYWGSIPARGPPNFLP